MTAYEKITNQIELLHAAEVTCEYNFKFGMAQLWRWHRAKLIQKRQAMTLQEAGALI